MRGGWRMEEGNGVGREGEGGREEMGDWREGGWGGGGGGGRGQGVNRRGASIQPLKYPVFFLYENLPRIWWDQVGARSECQAAEVRVGSC